MNHYTTQLQPLERLPIELLEEIAKLSDPRAAIDFSNSSKMLRRALGRQNNHLWYQILQVCPHGMIGHDNRYHHNYAYLKFVRRNINRRVVLCYLCGFPGPADEEIFEYYPKDGRGWLFICRSCRQKMPEPTPEELRHLRDREAIVEDDDEVLHYMGGSHLVSELLNRIYEHEYIGFQAVQGLQEFASLCSNTSAGCTLEKRAPDALGVLRKAYERIDYLRPNNAFKIMNDCSALCLKFISLLFGPGDGAPICIGAVAKPDLLSDYIIGWHEVVHKEEIRLLPDHDTRLSFCCYCLAEELEDGEGTKYDKVHMARHLYESHHDRRYDVWVSVDAGPQPQTTAVVTPDRASI